MRAPIHHILAPGGVFFTSAKTRAARRSNNPADFEPHTNDRTRTGIERLLAQTFWSKVRRTYDATGLRIFVRAVKEMIGAAQPGQRRQG